MQISSEPALAVITAGLSVAPILFISPHFDDVAFSCAGLVHDLARAGHRVVWATVFSAGRPNPTGFALHCQTSKGISADRDYMALRHAEDLAAAALLGAETPIQLRFLEAPHRGYGSAPMLFGEISRTDDMTINRIAAALQRLIQRIRPRRVVVPLGLGGHVDHRIVRRAAMRSIPLARLVFYVESPYVLRCSAGDLADLARGLRGHLHDVADRNEIRSAAYQCYASQLGYQLRGIGTAKAAAAKSSHRIANLCRRPGAAELYLTIGLQTIRAERYARVPRRCRTSVPPRASWSTQPQAKC